MTRTFTLHGLSERFNTQLAESFGKREFLFEREVRSPSPFNMDGYSRAVIRELREKRFDPAIDFLVLAGPTNSVAVLLAVAAREYQELRLLLFDAVKGTYVEKNLRVHPEDEV